MNSSGVDPCLTRIFVLYEALNEWTGAGGSCGERVFLITFSFIIGYSIV